MTRVFPALLLLLAACGEPPTILVTPLQVVSWAPSQGAQCVAARQSEFTATVTFSDDILPASLDGDALFVRPEGGEPLPATIEYFKATLTARLTVSADLAWSTVHELCVTDAVEGVSQGRLLQELASTFVTVSRGGCY